MVLWPLLALLFNYEDSNQRPHVICVTSDVMTIHVTEVGARHFQLISSKQVTVPEMWEDECAGRPGQPRLAEKAW